MANYSKTKSVFSRSRQAYLLGLMRSSQLSTVLFLLATLTGTCQRTCKSNLKIKPKYVNLITQPKIRLPPKFKSILSHLWLSDLISRSGDVHPKFRTLAHDKLAPRPIPVAPANDLLKTEIRPSSVTSAIWHHINCVGISPSTYHSLIHQDQSAHWFCKHCGIPNYTPTFSSDEQSISHSDSSEHNNAIFFAHDSEQPTFGPNPQNASTPERQKRTQ